MCFISLETIDEDQEEDAPLREELMKDVFTLADDCEIDYTRATKWPQILAAMAGIRIFII